MSLVRYSDWERRLNKLLWRSREATFQWGTFDCALHVCNCIRAMTGVDPGASYRGAYNDEASGMALIGGDLGAFAATTAASLGMPEVAVTFARRGDVVLVDNGDPNHALGIVGFDGRFAICASQNGLARARMDKWLRAWQVG